MFVYWGACSSFVLCCPFVLILSYFPTHRSTLILDSSNSLKILYSQTVGSTVTFLGLSRLVLSRLVLSCRVAYLTLSYLTTHSSTLILGSRHSLKSSHSQTVGWTVTFLALPCLILSRLVLSCLVTYFTLSYLTTHRSTLILGSSHSLKSPHSLKWGLQWIFLALPRLVLSCLVAYLTLPVSHYAQIHTDAKLHPQLEKSPQPKFSCLASSRLVSSCLVFSLTLFYRISLLTDPHRYLVPATAWKVPTAWLGLTL